jgi:Mg/Co/Ni transporter MgtE
VTNSDKLLRNFAQDSPDDFAAELAAAEAAEIRDILAALPPASAVEVLARLPSRTLLLLMEAGCDDLGEWLDAAAFESAAEFLVRLPSQQSSALVNRLHNAKLQRRLMRLLNFPSHCIGSLVFGAYMRVGADWSMARLMQEYQSIDSTVEKPAIVVDEAGRYKGVLDLWRIVTSKSSGGVALDFCRQVPPLIPEMSFASVVELRQWQSRNWLPVVDQEHRVLGSVRRDQVVEQARIAEEARGQNQDILYDLLAQLFMVMGNLMRRLLGAGSPR